MQAPLPEAAAVLHISCKLNAAQETKELHIRIHRLSERVWTRAAAAAAEAAAAQTFESDSEWEIAQRASSSKQQLQQP